jgi:hypothetical protein
VLKAMKKSAYHRTLATLISTWILCGPGLSLAQLQGTSNVSIILNEVFVIKISGGNITLSIQAPGTAGQPPGKAVDSTCYLQYTSSLQTGQSRRVTASWMPLDSAPSGCSLSLQAFPAARSGEGASAGQITVSSTAQIIITGITRCATGTGSTNGALLTYTLNVVAANNLIAGQVTSSTVTFTITDAS